MWDQRNFHIHFSFKRTRKVEKELAYDINVYIRVCPKMAVRNHIYTEKQSFCAEECDITKCVIKYGKTTSSLQHFRLTYGLFEVKVNHQMEIKKALSFHSSDFATNIAISF